MFKIILFGWLFVCLIHNGLAQVKVRGIVKNQLNEPLLVSVSLILSNNKGETVAYAYTNNHGEYILKLSELGQFKLTAQALGYESQAKMIAIESFEKEKIINFVLKSQSLQLKQVIVEAPRPIELRKDTIIFDAKAFTQGNEQVVEDLLKNIPGLNITKEGKIKVGNREIEKIMIGGDDLFGKGYKLLTKNMPAYPIDKIELYQHYSENKLLKGVEKSNKIALNLVLKKDAENIWFGNMQVGYDVENKGYYQIKGNIMNFGVKNKYYFLTGLNNVGKDNMADITHLMRMDDAGELGNIGEGEAAESLLKMGFKRPNMSRRRTDLSNTKLISLNSIVKLTDRLKLKTLGFWNAIYSNFFKESILAYTVNDITFKNTEFFEGKQKILTGFGKVDLDYDISSSKALKYTGLFSRTTNHNDKKLVYNGLPMLNYLEGISQLIDQKIVYTNKFVTNAVLLLSARYINEKRPQYFKNNQFLFDELFPKDSSSVNHTQQFSENTMDFFGVEANLMKKKSGGNLLEIALGNQLRIDRLNTQFTLFSDQEVFYPGDYQNKIKFINNDLFFKTRYHFDFGKINLLAQTDFHFLYNKLISEQKGGVTNTPFYIIPKVEVDWEINRDNKLSSVISYNTTKSGIANVYPRYIQTSYRSFSKGLNTFKTFNLFSSSISYNYGNWSDRFFGDFIFLYNYDDRFYSTNTFINSEYAIEKAILIKNRHFITSSLHLNYYFPIVKSNVKIKTSVAETEFKNVVNNSQLRRIDISSVNYGLSLQSAFKGIFNYHFGVEWLFSQVKNSYSNSYTNRRSYLDLSFIVNEKLNFLIKSERYIFGNLNEKNKAHFFVDLSANYSLKNERLLLSIYGNNLLNNEYFTTYNISDISSSKTRYRLLPRYVLLSLKYRF